MPAVGDTYALREGETVTIRSLSPDRLEVDATWAPAHGRPPRHHHPTQDERFTILEGELTFDLRGAVRAVGPGGRVDIPRGMVHRVWNAGQAPARATWEVTPAQRTAEMFAALDGGLNPARAARILFEFRREFRLSSSLRG